MDAVELLQKASLELFGREKISSFEAKLLLNSSRMKNFRGFLVLSTCEGAIMMVAAMSAAFLLEKTRPELYILAAAIGFAAPFFANYLFVDIVFEKRKRQKEELLCDLLLDASVFCEEVSAQQLVKRIAEMEYPLLGEDFLRAAKEMKNGASIEEALGHVKQLNQSKTYSRVADLLLHGYSTGAKMGNVMKETAEDLLENKAIIKERQAVMLVTKYTILLSCGLIVPALLGLIIGLVGGMNFDSIGELSLGLSIGERKEFFETSTLGTTIYVLEYALLSAAFLAMQEGNKKQGWVYALVLAPASLAVFFAAKTLMGG